jgi:hypothetical protein
MWKNPGDEPGFFLLLDGEICILSYSIRGMGGLGLGTIRMAAV